MMHSDLVLEGNSPEQYAERFPTEAFERAYDEGWTDGLPIIPPTLSRVREFVLASERAGDELIGILPPRGGRVTIEVVAINAVMAGCRPEYMPIIITAIEALTDPAFPLREMQTTTSSSTPFLLVNGAVRLPAGGNRRFVHFRAGCLGPGWRSNSTIGRAISLILSNGGGGLSGVYTQNSFGSPLRYSYMCGEFEEANPWTPFHVDRGFAREESTVTVFSASNYCNIQTSESETPDGILRQIASHMVPSVDHESVLLLLGVDHARALYGAGLSKRDMQNQLWQFARFPTNQFSQQFASFARAAGRADESSVWRCANPDHFHIVVAGGVGPQDVYISVSNPQIRIIPGRHQDPEYLELHYRSYR